MFKSLPPHLQEWVMYFVLVNDGVEVEKNVAYTPITLKVLNEPKDRRSKMGCIWLAAFFPPKVGNYQAMFTPLAANSSRGCNRGRTGLVYVCLTPTRPVKYML